MAAYHQIGIQVDAPEDMLEGPQEEPLAEIPAVVEPFPGEEGEGLMAAPEVPSGGLES
jgi:hypothetical protein